MSDFTNGATLPPGQEGEQMYRFRRFMIIMDSMTNAELDGLVTFHDYAKGTNLVTESRIRRIARGAGCHINEVKMTLQEHEQFKSMFGQYGKMAAATGTGVNNPMFSNKGQQQQFIQKMKKNPQATMNQLLNNMDPAMIQSMGGRQQVINMMEQMASGSGMGGSMGFDPLSMMMSGPAAAAAAAGEMDFATMMQNTI
jgi:signal recognition particle subunit SRP54